jgi:altronate dehydratase large subunit
MTQLEAYPRTTGLHGIRNHLAVVSTVVCSNVVATSIAERLGAHPVTHDTGCLQLGQDRELTVDSLVGAASNPNVGAVLLVGLGCEQQPPEALVSRFRGANLKYLTIQGSGGTESAIEQGTEVGRQLLAQVDQAARVPIGWPDLTIAMRVSDEHESTSKNLGHLLGNLVDVLVDRGCRLIVAETWPYLGMGDALLERFASDAVRGRWLEFERDRQALLSESGWSLHELLHRSDPEARDSASRLGTKPISGLLEYGQRPPAPGLWLMKSPHEDIFTGPGILSAGAQLLIHGSSRGNLYSPPILPVLKLSGDPDTFRLMPDAYDIDATEERSASEGVAAVLTRLEEVIRGESTQAERWNGNELAIPRIGATL